MTISEKLDKLRREVSDYHVEVREHIVRSSSFESAVQRLESDVYGVPGQKERHPGISGDVASLKHSRRWMLAGIRGVWAVILIAGGALLTMILKR